MGGNVKGGEKIKNSFGQCEVAAEEIASKPSRTPSSNAEASYDADFALWIEHQVALLRARRSDGLDMTHLVEELDAMGKSERRELASRLETLVVHLLKCQFQPESKCGIWLATLLEQRSQIGDLVDDSPSLRAFLEPLLKERFHRAVARASLETDLPSHRFPFECVYTVEQVLDVRFIP